MKILRLNKNDFEKLRLLEKLYAEVFEIDVSQNPESAYFENLLKTTILFILLPRKKTKLLAV